MGVNPVHLSVVDGASLTADEEPKTNAPSGPQEDATPDVDPVDAEFVAIYKAHYPRLVRALELSGTNRILAEDIAQEAFARTLSRWQRVKRGTNLPGYAYRVAFRLVRRRRRDLATFDERISPDIANEAALSVEIERVMQAMPPAQRRCAVLCLVIGVSTKDAARALGIAESTVRKQIERARRDLRQVLRAPS